MSLNDVCCLVPAWFGALATLLTGLMAYEACVGTYGVAAGGWGPPPPLPPGGAPSRPQPYQSVLAAFPVLGGVYRAAVRPLAGLALIRLAVAAAPLALILREQQQQGQVTVMMTKAMHHTDDATRRSARRPCADSKEARA